MPQKNFPPTLDELKKLRQPIINVNQAHIEQLSPSKKLAMWITEHVGTMGFFGIIFCWTVIWLGWNTIGPNHARFDPYPAFVLWLFISNMIQIFLMPLIMIGQNLQGQHDEARAQADYEVNVKAEREIEAILMHLERQGRQLDELLKKK